jgi:large subunit ribosomal protein L11
MLKSIVRLQIKSQLASAGPPLGPALGQFGVATMDFCKKFNEMSKSYKKGIILNTIVYVNVDRTYKIIIKGPSVSSQLKKILNSEKGCSFPGYLSNTQLLLTNYMLYEIFNLFNQAGLHSFGFYKTIKGSAYSSGYYILKYI